MIATISGKDDFEHKLISISIACYLMNENKITTSKWTNHFSSDMKNDVAFSIRRIEVPRTNKSVYIKPNVVTNLFWSGTGRLGRSVFKCKNSYDGSDATEIKIFFQNDTKRLDRFWKQNEIALINFPPSVWLISRLLIEFAAFDFIYCVCIVISMMCYLLLCSNVQIWMRECVTRKTCILHDCPISI